MVFKVHMDFFPSRFYYDGEQALLLRQPPAGRGGGGREPGVHLGGRHLLPGLAGVLHLPHRQQRSVAQEAGSSLRTVSHTQILAKEEKIATVTTSDWLHQMDG